MSPTRLEGGAVKQVSESNLAKPVVAKTGDSDAGGFIEIEDLVVRYGNLTAVNSVSFNVRQGELLTLLGRSGCG